MGTIRNNPKGEALGKENEELDRRIRLRWTAFEKIKDSFTISDL